MKKIKKYKIVLRSQPKAKKKKIKKSYPINRLRMVNYNKKTQLISITMSINKIVRAKRDNKKFWAFQ